MNKYLFVIVIMLILASCGDINKTTNSKKREPIELKIAIEQFSQQSDECNTKKQNGCATLKASYPILKSENDSINDMLIALNKSIYTTFSQTFIDFIPEGNLQSTTPVDQMIGSFFKKHAKDQMKFEEKISYELMNNISIAFYNNDFVSMEQTIMTYEGGAHPNTSIYYKTLDLKTGDQLNVYEWLADTIGLKTEILAGIKAKMKMDPSTNLKEKGFFVSDQELTIARDILIQADSISFMYNTYDIAPYVYGNFDITLPLSKVSLID